MKRRVVTMKKAKNLFIAVVIGIITILPCEMVSAQTLTNDNFKNLLDSYNISISGESIELDVEDAISYIGYQAQSQNMYNSAYKLENIADEETIAFSPKEILEMHYNSLSVEEQRKFLTKVENQTVDIQQNDNIILISYNVNDLETRATSTITSSREAVIKLQDSVLGNWGSATVELTGKFTKTTSGNNWTISLKNSSDYSVTESVSSPMQIVGTTVYWGDGYVYSSSGTYLGNEIKINSRTDVVCGFNSSSLSIYVYPNSEYNYAKIG